jgi:hypothetical protein
MTRERKAQIATVIILGGALTFVVARRSGLALPAFLRPATPSTPQDTVYRMLDAARDGNVGAYLRCYTSEMESSLKQIVKERGDNALAGYIRSFNAAIKGVAIQEPQSTVDNEVRERVEFIYGDRNEAQTYYLRRTGAEWRIERQENTQGVSAVVPYGSPVVE